jgi:hypothetical protein
VEFCVAQRAEAVFLAATMPSTLLHLEKTISGIRSMLGNACPPLITAGAAFAADASLASHSGGDFHFDSLRALAQWAQSSS